MNMLELWNNSYIIYWNKIIWTPLYSLNVSTFMTPFCQQPCCANEEKEPLIGGEDEDHVSTRSLSLGDLDNRGGQAEADTGSDIQTPAASGSIQDK